MSGVEFRLFLDLGLFLGAFWLVVLVASRSVVVSCWLFFCFFFGFVFFCYVFLVVVVVWI